MVFRLCLAWFSEQDVSVIKTLVFVTQASASYDRSYGELHYMQKIQVFQHYVTELDISLRASCSVLHFVLSKLKLNFHESKTFRFSHN